MGRIYETLEKLLKSVKSTSTNTNLALTGFTATADSTVEAQLSATGFRVREPQTAPSAANDTGTAGEIRFAADAIYFCTEANTWKKIDIATWGG